MATMGPAVREEETLRRLLGAGLDAARINASHAQPAEIVEEISLLKALREEAGSPLAIMLDLMGPKVRVGEIRGGVAVLRFGQEFTLTTSPRQGDQRGVHVDIPSPPSDLLPGDEVALDDGAIRLKVQKVKGKDISCRVEVGGELRSRKGVSFPGRNLNLPALTEKDLRDLELGLEHGVDWIALSLVRSSDDVLALKEEIRKRGGDRPVMAKVERSEALQDIEGIIEAADAVMVARGDLGVERPIEEVPLIQKDLVRRLAHQGKPVVVATQMMESMIYHPYPTRAEASDIANAVFDGADALMLAAETAVGRYPVKVVEMMGRIIERAEEDLPYPAWWKERESLIGQGTVEATCFAACELARQVEARALVAVTESGFTAFQLARFRPSSPVIALTPHPDVAFRLKLAWGVTPLLMEEKGALEKRLRKAADLLEKQGLAEKGDRVVVVAGLKGPRDPVTTTNLIKVEHL
jgi:pyruvate kinase